MARMSPLEAQLTEITREFVTKIVATIRSASFADVAGYVPATSTSPTRTRAAARRGHFAGHDQVHHEDPRRARRRRQSDEKRAEVGEKILTILNASTSPMGVRAIASAAGMASDLLAAPLKQLREEGKIQKHGVKRSTTYSAL